MPVTVSVLYPTEATFDMDYYLNSHMPLVESKFTPHGLTSWTVSKLDGGPYGIHCLLKFESRDAFDAAFAKEGEVVTGDVKNFSDKTPSRFVGDVVGSTA